MQVVAEPAREPSRQLVRREVLHAEELAQGILGEAHDTAKQVITQANEAAAALIKNAAREGYEQGRAVAAKAALAFAKLEAEADQRALDRSLQIARVLSERLLGKSLELDPTTIADLTRQALAEVRGAHQIQLICNPEDAAVLRSFESSGSISGAALALHPSPAQPRGQVQITTNVGDVDASIGSRLDVLVSVLKESASEQ